MYSIILLLHAVWKAGDAVDSPFGNTNYLHFILINAKTDLLSDQIKKNVKGTLSRRFCCILIKTTQIFDNKNRSANMKLLLENREENIK